MVIIVIMVDTDRYSRTIQEHVALKKQQNALKHSRGSIVYVEQDRAKI